MLNIRKMKKLLLSSYIVLLHVFIGMALFKPGFVIGVQKELRQFTGIPEFTDHFYRMLKYHKRMDGNVPQGAVVFIGDSMIQALYVSAITPLAVNYGIGADTSRGILKRLPEYHSLARASAAVIAIGINEIGRYSNEEMLANYRAIVNALPEHLPIVFSAALPVDEKIYGAKGINERIRSLSASLRALCATSQRLFFVDAGPLLIDEDGNLADALHDGDGFHLTAAGNEVWIRQLREALERVQQSAAQPQRAATGHSGD